ncbi:uncharacterized protein METZ01_LOCUS410789 [marine metagenome]|uniref:Uncharacterized protein n=1 Tax=marine metagenome TaxID=408172 RepID=A0A382WHV1_9ZZZZ
MKMLKKGFIALTVLGVVLFFATFVLVNAPFVLVNLGFDLGFDPVGWGERLADTVLLPILALGFIAISFGIGGTVIAISYEKWVEYRNSEVKSAEEGALLPLLQIGFAALTVLGVVLFFGGGFLPAGFEIGGNIYTWLGMFLFPLGAAGWFVVAFVSWLVSRVADRKRD